MINELMNYIDYRQLGLTSFIDILSKDIIVSENNNCDSTNLTRIPSREELFPYRKAIEEYLVLHDLEIPYGEKPSTWLRNYELYDDFRAFYDDLVKARLEEWYMHI